MAPAIDPTPAVQLLPRSTPPEAAPAGETERETPAPSPTIRSGEFTADATEVPSTAAPSLGADEITISGSAAAGTVSVVTAVGFVAAGLTSFVVAAGASGAAALVSAGASASAFAQNMGNAGGGVGGQLAAQGAEGSSSSIRRPATTMAIVALGQLQFLATLSLVDNTGTEDSELSDFANNLRWVNLWPPASLARSFAPVSMYGELGLEGEEDEESGDLSSGVFIGNLVLFLIILLIIFLIHMTVASAIEAYWLAERGAEKQVARAHRRGVPVREISARLYNPWAPFDPNSESQRSLRALEARGDSEGEADDTDAEEGMPQTGGRRKLSEIAECREKSQSLWLHFPHVELMYLLFAFEGAVAAQVSAIWEDSTLLVLILASLALMTFPVLMTINILCTFFGKIRPKDHIVFVPNEDDAVEAESGLYASVRGFGSKVRDGLKESYSMFAWADKGGWESVDTPNEEDRRAKDWFRIGFEPIFVDFTGAGAWFAVYALIELVANAVVGVVVEDSVLQLWLFCATNTLGFLLLAVLKPFANGIINFMGYVVYGLDAASMAVLAVSADKWEGTERASRVDSAVMMVQLLILAGIVIPLYVDTGITLVGSIRDKIQRGLKEDDNMDAEERKYVRRYILGAWARFFCVMLRNNVFAFLRETTAGYSPSVKASAATVRVLSTTVSARTGPYPPLDTFDFDESMEFGPRRPRELGTVDTPIAVPPAPVQPVEVPPP
ncbi:unnamed protein product [Ectocarpus fasciculatus]